MLKNILTNNKLIAVIVKRGNARKAVELAKKAGAEGGTIILGMGGKIPQKSGFFGMSLLPEIELILTVIGENKQKEVWHSICDFCTTDRKKRGIAFSIDLAGVSGVYHLCDYFQNIDETEEKGRSEMEGGNNRYKLIVTIINKGDSELVLQASEKAGARGGTVIFGRGTGIHEKAKLFGINIEPEKEIILTLIEKEKTASVLDAIIQETELDKPGHGIAFIVDVEAVAGISRIDELKK